jgi:hypothetical protein
MGKRTMKKRLCILQVTPSLPNEKHVELFSEKDNCDFFFVTHDDPHDDALKFCPNTTWTDTRNVLAELVPKEYEYYAFVDYDYVFRPLRNLNPLDQIIEDLEKHEPAVLTYYPGNGMITPFAENTDYRDSKDASVLPFSHCGMKVVHHSLLSWFFPMITRFGGGVEACHLFNILEIPFMADVVCSHKMVYDNGVTDTSAPHNQDGAYNKYRMDEMWKWIRPAFKKESILKKMSQSADQLNDSLLIKNVFINLVLKNNLEPKACDKKKTFMNIEKVSRFFDLSHERFNNIHLNLREKTAELKTSTIEIINGYLSSLTFEDFRTQKDPWIEITNNINALIKDDRKIEINECVTFYQKLDDNQSLFHKNCKIDEDLCEYLKDKRVAFVGPSPYLNGKLKGELIDSYDVIVRIQHNILSFKDYGSRTDIIQSCLNKNYGPPVIKHLKQLDNDDKPKFVICNDTASELDQNGKWLLVDEVYEKQLSDLGTKMVHLKNDDNSWDRWALYWQVYPKDHIEKFSKGSYTIHSSNFNSGYGSLNHLLRYPLKELAIFGLDFYNTGIPQDTANKYNKSYTDEYGVEGTPMGPDKILHDQLSQMMHCKNILLKDKRVLMDEEVFNKLNSEQVIDRIEKFIFLPKFKHETR